MDTVYDKSKLIGKWKLETSENFEEYMKELGIGWTLRKMALAQNPTITIYHSALEEGKSAFDESAVWTIQTSSPIKSSKVNFVLRKPFKHMTLYDKEVDDVVEFDENGKLKEVHMLDGKEIAIIYRFVNTNDEMMTVCHANDITATRKYKRLE